MKTTETDTRLTAEVAETAEGGRAEESACESASASPEGDQED